MQEYFIIIGVFVAVALAELEMWAFKRSYDYQDGSEEWVYSPWHKKWLRLTSEKVFAAQNECSIAVDIYHNKYVLDEEYLSTLEVKLRKDIPELWLRNH